MHKHMFKCHSKQDTVAKTLTQWYYSSMSVKAPPLQLVCWTACLDMQKRKHQSSALLAVVKGIHRAGGFFSHRANNAEGVFMSWCCYESNPKSKYGPCSNIMLMRYTQYRVMIYSVITQPGCPDFAKLAIWCAIQHDPIFGKVLCHRISSYRGPILHDDAYSITTQRESLVVHWIDNRRPKSRSYGRAMRRLSLLLRVFCIWLIYITCLHIRLDNTSGPR